mmetsp:Transcript_4659/g.11264  ORF Transcript_4659/g.11264 Transcript_4659/m.11264 type:complete len:604 (+) Transcript_4659:171-1982(+)
MAQPPATVPPPIWDELSHIIVVASRALDDIMHKCHAHAAALGTPGARYGWAAYQLPVAAGNAPEVKVLELARTLAAFAAEVGVASAVLDRGLVEHTREATREEAAADVAAAAMAVHVRASMQADLQHLEEAAREAHAGRVTAEMLTRRREAELVGLSFALRDALLALQNPANMPDTASAAARFGLVEVIGRIPPRAALAIWPELEWGKESDGNYLERLLPADMAKHGALLVRHRGKVHLMKEAAMLHSSAPESRGSSVKSAVPQTANLRAGSIVGADYLRNTREQTPGPPPLPPNYGANYAHGHSEKLDHSFAQEQSFILPSGTNTGEQYLSGWNPGPDSFILTSDSSLDISPLADARGTIAALRMAPRAHARGGGSGSASARTHGSAASARGGSASASARTHDMPSSARKPEPPAPGIPRALAGRRLSTRSVSEERGVTSHTARSLETELILRKAEELQNKYTPRFATREGQRDARTGIGSVERQAGKLAREGGAGVLLNNGNTSRASSGVGRLLNSGAGGVGLNIPSGSIPSGGSEEIPSSPESWGVSRAGWTRPDSNASNRPDDFGDAGEMQGMAEATRTNLATVSASATQPYQSSTHTV